jgi:hypothetical protein
MRPTALALVCAAVLAFASAPAAAQDMIDPATIQIVDAPDFRPWPIAGHFSDITVDPGGRVTFHVAGQNCDVTPTQCWPITAPTTRPLQFTVWLFLQINGRWVGSAFIPGINSYNLSANYFDTYARDWYYCCAWNPMTGHVIQEGETIGFMFGGGDNRHSEGPSSGVRSNIVTISATHGVHTFGDPPPPTATPPVQPSPPPVLAPPPVPPPVPTLDLSSLQQSVSQLHEDLTAQNQAVNARLDTLTAAVNNPSWIRQALGWIASPQGMMTTGGIVSALLAGRYMVPAAK